jgi:hypothetical protein
VIDRLAKVGLLGYNGIDGEHEIDSMEVMVDMERAHQMIGADGLQIPLPLMQRYGLRAGVQVVLELGADGIRVVPALADKSEIEGKALRYVLRNLGDAVSVEAQRLEEAWHVTVYTSAGTAPIGRLVYDLAGELLKEDSTPPEIMRRRAIEVAGDQY